MAIRGVVLLLELYRECLMFSFKINKLESILQGEIRTLFKANLRDTTRLVKRKKRPLKPLKTRRRAGISGLLGEEIFFKINGLNVV